MSVFSAFAQLSGWTMVSRILGFGRDFLMAVTLGPGPLTDVFIVALRFPNLFRRLFAEGAFNAAFIPQFSKKLEQQGRKAAEFFGNQALAMMIAFLTLFSAFVIIFMPQIMPLLVPGFTASPEKIELTIYLSRITFPYLFCMSASALLSGIYNTYGRFSATAIAPIFFNCMLILVLAAVYADIDFLKTHTAPVHWLAWAVFISGFMQLALMFIAARQAGFRYKFLLPRWNDDMRILITKMLPALLAAGVLQINLVVGDILASLLGDKAISWLFFSDKLIQLPLGVIASAIAVAVLPFLSLSVQRGDKTLTDAYFIYGLRIALFFTMPASLALVIMPQDIIAALFGYGKFSASDIQATAYALKMVGPGLIAFVVVKIFVAVFFAHEDTKSPALLSVVAALFNGITAYILMQFMAHAGIALASSLAGFANACMLWWLLRRRGLWPKTNELMLFLLKCLPPLCVMLVILLAFQTYLPPLQDLSKSYRILVLLAEVSTAGIAYIAVGILCRCVGYADWRR